jgi:hypothetical protein
MNKRPRNTVYKPLRDLSNRELGELPARVFPNRLAASEVPPFFTLYLPFFFLIFVYVVQLTFNRVLLSAILKFTIGFR